jgi:hypothetical protein
MIIQSNGKNKENQDCKIGTLCMDVLVGGGW